MIKKILLLLALLSGLNSKPLSAGQIPMQIIDKTLMFLQMLFLI